MDKETVKLIVEEDELQDKIIDLSTFVNKSPNFTVMDKDEQDTLKDQLAIMVTYRNILNKRLKKLGVNI
jgi:hypothetical protein